MQRTRALIRLSAPLTWAAVACFLVIAGGCTEMRPTPQIDAENHLPADTPARADPEVPDLVEPTPYLPPPAPIEETELYTVVVNEVPVKELLFALARDADLNVDVVGDLEGTVTLNAIDQTLTQILDRLSRQVAMR